MSHDATHFFSANTQLLDTLPRPRANAQHLTVIRRKVFSDLCEHKASYVEVGHHTHCDTLRCIVAYPNIAV
jgi:hypothetical protein